MLEAVLEASAVVEIDLILVLRINVLAANLPEERMELVFVAILLEIVENLDLFAVCLEVGPNIPVDGYDNLALKILCHTENVYGGHLVLHTDRVLAEGTECNINVMILAMLCEINGEMRIS